MTVRQHKTGLRNKIIVALLIVGLVPIIVGLSITYWNGIYRLRESMGHNFQGLAREAARKTDLVIEKEIEGKRNLSINKELKQALKESNRNYRALSDPEIRNELAQLNRRWDEDDPTLKEAILMKDASILLRSFMVTKGILYPAFYLTDEKGAIVASVNGFPDFLHSQESWWKEAYNDGVGKVYIGDLAFIEKSQSWVINIAVPVIDEEKGKTIGILVVFHDIRTLIQPYIHDIRFGETGHAMLIDSLGRVLTCPVMPTGSYLKDSGLLTSVISSTPGWIRAIDDGHGGHDSIVGFSEAIAASEITLNSTGKTWHSFIRQDPRELYAPINSLLMSVSMSGLVLVGFVVVMGVMLSKKLAKPVQILHEGAEEIGKGNLDVKLDIRTNDEIEQLADEFNRMAEKLKESYSTLEKKVDSRTRQLTALNITATTINRSLDLQEILENSLDKIIELMQFQAGAIRLLDSTKTRLHLKVTRGLPPDFSSQYQDIAVKELIAGQVAASGQPLIIEDARKHPLHESPIFKLGYVSMVAIPLKSKDRVVGTLTGTGRTPRIFTESEIELMTSIGNQLGIAIENATLYSQTLEMVEQLKEADRFKSEFFSNVSHELRAPLTSIIGYSELLLDEMTQQLNSKQEEYITNIQSSGSHLLDIINNLLDLSKIRAGKMELHFGEFSMRSVIHNCIKAVTPLVTKKGQVLESRMGNGNFVISADEVKVKQILLNLLSNAIKFTYQGGLIAIEVRACKLEDQDAIEVSVIDSGVGIKDTDLIKIFEEFRQADTSYTRQFPGTGLGLPIVKRFVEMHHGQVKLESQIGKGSRFSFILPTRMESEKEVTAKSGKDDERIETSGLTDSGQVNSGMTVLIVEKDLHFTHFLQSCFTGLGYRTIHVDSVIQAIEKSREVKPGLITLDVLLPDRDGWEVLSSLKGIPETSKIPVIIISNTGNREMALSMGAIDYLAKPLRIETLLECLKRHNLSTGGRRRAEAASNIPEKFRIIDPLTGLHNEKYFEDTLRQRLDKLLDTSSLNTILITRIDYFKELNEKTGRIAADETIKRVAKMFCDSLRKPDLVCRCYGSTFGIVLTETPKENAIGVGNKLKSLLEKESFPNSENIPGRTITMSIGIFEITEGIPSVEAFLTRARRTLDEAEKRGGNQLITALL
ncbi:MAG: diguanylate cyclase [Nitrospirae bacterium]|nr:diguanylate cyclase [Nitrospirota bacterium]MBI3595474.1 diguanylate cyclase [Nitrospirota bacterium]